MLPAPVRVLKQLNLIITFKLYTLSHTHTLAHAFAIHLNIDKNFCLRAELLAFRINNDFNMLIDNFLMNFISAAISPVNMFNESAMYVFACV